MVTPGSTPPVASVIVPVSVASCANAKEGNSRRNETKMNRRSEMCSTVFLPLGARSLQEFKMQNAKCKPPPARKQGGEKRDDVHTVASNHLAFAFCILHFELRASERVADIREHPAVINDADPQK